MPEKSDPPPGPAMQVSLLDLMGALSAALDLVSPFVVNHHQRVAYVAARLASQLGLSRDVVFETLLAGLCHDIGAFSESLTERLDTFTFETSQVGHSETGYLLLSGLPDLDRTARIIRRHHTPVTQWDGLGEHREDLELAGIIHLADRVDVLSRRPGALIGGATKLLGKVRSKVGTLFASDQVAALEDAVRTPWFWEDFTSPGLMSLLRGMGAARDRLLGLDQTLAFTGIFSQVIDFRSRFTSTHSRGVSAIAVALARLAGFDAEQCKFMHMAGDLHDLGKLAIPASILDKPDKLTPDEYSTIQEHALHSHTILGRIPGLGPVQEWGAAHHERLDGGGYPFQLMQYQLKQGARIMAVADVFTALTEDRPYRTGMDRNQTLEVLRDMAASGRLDQATVGMVEENFTELDQIRLAAQAQARDVFASFIQARDAAVS